MKPFGEEFEKKFNRNRGRREFRARIENLERQKRKLARECRFVDREQKKQIHAEMQDVDRKINAEFMQNRLYADGFRKSDLRRYYRHIRVTRPVSMVFSILLWGVLFWLVGSSSVALRIVILIFALASTFGSAFELAFLLRVKSRILTPVEELERGVEEVAKGNYDVRVETSMPNEISTLIAAFNNMAEKLRGDERIKSEYEENRKALVANISHDLKTPMTSIEGYVEALLERDDLSDEKKNRYLKIISSNTDYMNRLIDDLFLFSKLDMQKLDFHFERVGIRSFLRDMMEELGLDFEERGIAFRYRDELKEDGKVRIDGKRFHQVMTNITANAVKYGPREGLAIDVRLYADEGGFCIGVSDNGPGIPPEKLSHVFERFYRVDSERTKDFSGTGLGLAIAKELIDAHGGRISVANRACGGTCFTIWMPAASNDETM